MKEASHTGSHAVRDFLEQARLTVHFTLTSVAIIKKQTITSVDKDAEKLEPSYIEKWYSCCRKQSGSSPQS